MRGARGGDDNEFFFLLTKEGTPAMLLHMAGTLREDQQMNPRCCYLEGLSR